MEHYVGAAIAMNQVSRNIKAWNWDIIEHLFVSMEDVPVRLGNTILSFATTSGSKVKWPMDIRVQMTYI